jgi:hypothetical protein
MTVYTLQLDPTATFGDRSVTLVRHTAYRDPEPGGVVEVREAKEPHGKPKCRRYALRGDVLPNGDRRFRLTKPDGGGTYFVCLPADPHGYPTCECVGYEHKGWCVHVAALRALVAGQCF